MTNSFFFELRKGELNLTQNCARIFYLKKIHSLLSEHVLANLCNAPADARANACVASNAHGLLGLSPFGNFVIYKSSQIDILQLLPKLEVSKEIF